MKAFADINISEKGELTDVNTLFDLYHENDDMSFYLSKKTYHFEDGDLKFDYKYTIKVFNLYEWTGEDVDKNRFGFELKIVPTKESISEKCRDCIRESCCVEPDELDMFDIDDYGCGVTIGYSQVDNIESWSDKKIDFELNFIATCMPFIEEKGEEYYFNIPWNKIGTDGWASLRHEILDEPLF